MPLRWRTERRNNAVGRRRDVRERGRGGRRAARARGAAAARGRAGDRRQRLHRRHPGARPRARPGRDACSSSAATPASPPAPTRARAPPRGDLLLFLNPDATPAPGFAEAIRAPLADGRGWDAWMGLVTAGGGRDVNTSGGIVHFTGIAWAGEAGVPAPGSATGPARWRSRRARAWPCRAPPGSGSAASRATTSCTTRTSTSRCACAWPAGACGIEPARGRRPRLRVRQGGGQVAPARAQPLGDDPALLPGPLLRCSRPRCWPPSWRCWPGGGRRLAAAEAARGRRDACARCRGCGASAARSRPRAG